MTVIRTERGWAGHFICAQRCLFRRNTLLERGDVRLVVSTVGAMQPPGTASRAFFEIGLHRYYETMVFHVKWDGAYWDADVSRKVNIPASLEWRVDHVRHEADQEANDMHEAIVTHLTKQLEMGEVFPTNEERCQ